MNEREKLEAAAKAAGISLEWEHEIPFYKRGSHLISWDPENDIDDSQHLADLCGITIRTTSATSGKKLISALAPDGTEVLYRDHSVRNGMLKVVFKCAVLLGVNLP